MGKKETPPGPLSLDSERALLRSCLRAEEGAWERFLSQYARLIYYSIHRTLALKHYRATPEEVEDIFHDLLVHLIRDNCKKLKQYQGKSGCTVATWVRTITVRFVIDYLRQQVRNGATVDIESEEVWLEASLQNPVPSPDQNLEEKEKESLIEAAFSGLNENDKYFIELYYKKGYPPERVAELLGVSVKTVYSRINRIKEKIQEHINFSGRK